MWLKNELHLLCDTFKKRHIRTAIVAPNESAARLFDTGENTAIHRPPQEGTVQQYLGEIEPCTVYRLTDEFHLSYMYLLLSFGTEQKVLYVGPYLKTTPSAQQLLELGEYMRVSPKGQRYLNEYYAGIPVLPENDSLFLMLDTFCEQVWQVPSFSIVNVGERQLSPATPIADVVQEDNFDDLLINMKAMEQRYNFENELMRAVTLGQLHKETLLLSAFTERAFEKRNADPLRNLKNYCIIMNTLLRKAAEEGGVHPLYLDRVSSDFAQKIESLPSISDNGDLMRSMFRSYCRLVRKHSMKDYSRVVQKTVVLIDSDLSADLSLRSLAESQGISAGYLSSVFKKETGKTVSEYIREKRIKHAEHLLSTTHLQVQTVALHCGVLDVQYFSKIFKKTTGKTPKEYRDSLKQKGRKEPYGKIFK